MIKLIEDSFRELAKIIETLLHYDIEYDCEEIGIECDKYFRIMFNINLIGKENYSFATKYFHWYARNQLPIVDSMARIAINKLQADNGVSKDDLIVPYPDENDYSKWIRFYSSVIGNISKADREELINFDRTIQEDTDSRLCITNTLLRILDKYFYFEGRVIKGSA